MYQQEIKFFWPLTEQIRLDLDYTPCEEFERQKNIYSVGTLSSVTYNGNVDATWSSVVTAKIDTSEFVFRPKCESVGKWEITTDVYFLRPTKPNWLIRFCAKKLLGWKWHDVV